MAQSSAGTSPDAKRRHWAIPYGRRRARHCGLFHHLSVTGDSDLFFALATGAVGFGFTWAVLEVEFWFRSRKRG